MRWLSHTFRLACYDRTYDPPFYPTRNRRGGVSDLKLFRLSPTGAEEVPSRPVAVERSLQAVVERHIGTILGLRLLASDYATGRSHGGRIDTLGLDENGCPVIVEYKRAVNENVINQGLFYLDWLLDHRAEVKLLALERLDRAAAEAIEWDAPRLLCVAGDFTRYDAHAIKQIDRSIDLIRYRRYGDDFLLLELAATSRRSQGDAATVPVVPPTGSPRRGRRGGAKAVVDRLAAAPTEVQHRYDALAAFLTSLGEDVQVRVLTSYVAFRRLTNFACVEVQPQQRRVVVYAKVDPSTVPLEQGFTRDVRAVGHPGTGSLEIVIDSDEDVERAKPLLARSFEAN